MQRLCAWAAPACTLFFFGGFLISGYLFPPDPMRSAEATAALSRRWTPPGSPGRCSAPGTPATTTWPGRRRRWPTTPTGSPRRWPSTVAVDLGQFNIRVNTLCPMGGMSANFMRESGLPLVDEESLFEDYQPSDSPAPLHRPTPPRLAFHARAALFLVSDDAAWVNGVALPTDGGAGIRPQMDIQKTIAAYRTARFVQD